MSSTEISVIVFAGVFGGAIVGMALRSVVPEHHLNADSKDVIKLSVGLIGTMTALVLGLLVASAKSAYDTRRAEVTLIAASAIMVDRVLAHYGTETGEARRLLKVAVGGMIDQIWTKSGNGTAGAGSAPAMREEVFDKIQELEPHNDAQRSLQTQAESLALNLGQTRWLLFEQSGSSISTPFLVIVVFWLSILFVSFGLFAPRNGTTIVALLVSAISVAGAIFLIMELDRPFSGLIQISSAPLHNALVVLGK